MWKESGSPQLLDPLLSEGTFRVILTFLGFSTALEESKLAQTGCPLKKINYFPCLPKNKGVVKVKGRSIPSNQSKLTDL